MEILHISAVQRNADKIMKNVNTTKWEFKILLATMQNKSTTIYKELVTIGEKRTDMTQSFGNRKLKKGKVTQRRQQNVRLLYFQQQDNSNNQFTDQIFPHVSQYKYIMYIVVCNQ